MTDWRVRLEEALALLTEKGDFLRRISRHNAYEFVAAVADVSEAARLVVAGETVEWCETHRVVSKIVYVEGYDGHRECQDAPYFDGDCRIVSSAIIPLESADG